MKNSKVIEKNMKKNEEKVEKKREKNKNKKKSKIRKFLKLFFLILLLALICFSAQFAWKVKQIGGGTTGIIGAVIGSDAETLANLPEVKCLLLGQSQNLTDTIMVASYDPKVQEARLLTIPRDTFVGKNKAKARTYDKINALCQYDYPEKTLAAVNEITGLDIKNYCLIDTKALIEMVDLIGGVWFDVPIDMDYEDFTQDLYVHLKAGYQLLDGHAAEGVLRFRHNQDGTTYSTEYGQQDIGRSRTQRAFLTELAKQTLKPQNIFKLKDMLNLFYDHVKTNMNLSDIKDYLPHMVNFDTANIKSDILPGDVETCNKLSFYIHNKKETEKVVKELFKIQDEELVEEDEENSKLQNKITENTIVNGIQNVINENNNLIDSGKITDNEKKFNIELLNGTDNKNALFNVKNKLEANGYMVVKTGNTNLTAKTTIIDRVNLNKTQIDKIENILSVGFVSSGNKTENIDITIIIGNDY